MTILCSTAKTIFASERLRHENNLRTSLCQYLREPFQKKYIYSFLGLSLSDLRFIVNMFFLWTGSKDQLITFLNGFNTMHNLTILTEKKHPKIKL